MRGSTRAFGWPEMAPLLEVRDLKVSFRTEDGLVRAVDGVSFTVDESEVVGIVGESGSGKSVSMLTVMRLITDPNAIYQGEIIYKGRDLMGLSRDAMREVRGEEIAMIFQDPMTSLNPVYTIGWQIAEQVQEHHGLTKGQARRRTIELLGQVGIPRPEQRIDDYPHQFSGGMRQRVMIALALSCNPDLLIADEPTTALDVTIQAQILELIKDLKRDFRSAVVLITHDLGVVADIADRILVMYAGRIVEQGDKEQIFYDPQHPYTWGLLGSIARLDRPKVRRLTAIAGQPPSMINRPRGCSFRPRCPQAFDRCRVEDPPLTEKVGDAHPDACHLAVEDKRERRDATINPPLAAESA
jgi:peptide/nickel transport system ATP-binding protein